MNPLQEEKITLMLPPQVKNNGDFGTQTPLNLAGAGAAKVEIMVGATDVAIGSDAETEAPYLEECDTPDGAYTKITGTELSDVIAATDDNKVYAIDVPNIPQRKQYVRVMEPHAGSGTNGALLCIRGVVTKLSTGPASAAERGYAEHIIP